MGEHRCGSPISIKVKYNFLEIAFPYSCSTVDLLNIFRTYYYENTSGGITLKICKKIQLTFCKKQCRKNAVKNVKNVEISCGTNNLHLVAPKVFADGINETG